MHTLESELAKSGKSGYQICHHPCLSCTTLKHAQLNIHTTNPIMNMHHPENIHKTQRNKHTNTQTHDI